MKIAIVHDYLTQYGGAERVLEVFSELFPRAPIYTLIYDEKSTGGAFKGKEIITSFLQKIPFSSKLFRSLPFLMPFAVEQFDLSYFDVVVSNSTSFSKGIITKPNTLHISYCPTPPRYLWHEAHESIGEYRFPRIIKPLIPFLTSYLRVWDFHASSRVDEFVSVSKFIQHRIKKYYNRDSFVIHPSIDTKKFFVSEETKDYFLAVGRMMPYKRFDLIVEAFKVLGLPLKIIGNGPEYKNLKSRIKGYNNIEFLGLVSDDKLHRYYSEAKALIFPQEEDFGLVAIEIMASGRPIIAYSRGGALEFVTEGVTGIFFDQQSVDSLVDAVKRFNGKRFDSQRIRENSLNWDKEVFKKKFMDFLNSKVNS